MNQNAILKEIDDHINIRNNIWTGLLVISGGTLTLITNPDNIIKIVLIVLGLIMFFTFLNGYFNRIKIIKKLNGKLKGD